MKKNKCSKCKTELRYNCLTKEYWCDGCNTWGSALYFGLEMGGN